MPPENLPMPKRPRLLDVRKIERAAPFLLRGKIPIRPGHHPTYIGGELKDGDIASLEKSGGELVLGLVHKGNFYATHTRDGGNWKRIVAGPGGYEPLADLSRTGEGLDIGVIPGTDVYGKRAPNGETIATWGGPQGALISKLGFIGPHAGRKEARLAEEKSASVSGMKALPPLSRGIMNADFAGRPVGWESIRGGYEPKHGDILVRLGEGPHGHKTPISIGVVAEEGKLKLFYPTHFKRGNVFIRGDDLPIPLSHNNRELADLREYGRGKITMRGGLFWFDKKVSNVFEKPEIRSRLKRWWKYRVWG